MQRSIKKDFENRLFMYPSDAHYIRVLAQNLGLAAQEYYKLFSIMGGQELANTLPLANYRHFQCLKPNDTDYRFNLHLHTHFSDGLLDPLQVLNQAVTIADNNASDKTLLPPFTVAITDHNDIQALSIVLKELIKNPEKYYHLRVVLGCELGSVWKDKSKQKIPFIFEMLYYCLNPFDEVLHTYLQKHLQIRQQIVTAIFKQLKATFSQAKFSQKEAFKQDKILAQNLSFGTAGRIFSYAQQKLPDSDLHQQLYEICYAYHHAFDLPAKEDPYQDYLELFDIQKRSGFGFLGVAHPQKMNVGNFLSQAFIDDCNAHQLNAGYELALALLNKLKSAGLQALEINYQFDLPSFQNAQKMLNGEIPVDESDGNYHWLKFFADYAGQYDLLKTGGYDTHSCDIKGR